MNYDDEDEQDYFTPEWAAKAGIYHAIQTNPMNVWLGISKMLDYFTSFEGDEDEMPEFDEALEILVRYSLTGYHPKYDKIVYTYDDDEIDRQAALFRDVLDKVSPETEEDEK